MIIIMNKVLKVSHFGVRCKAPVYDPDVFKGHDKMPYLIDGVNELDTLCPVSKLTGHRGNPLQLLRMALSDKNSRLLDSILQELPTVQELDVSDDDKLSLLVSRLDTGSFAENDVLVQELSKVTDILFPDNREVQQQIEQGIEFKPADLPDGAAGDNS